MNAHQLADLIAAHVATDDDAVDNVDTFADAGVMSTDAGLVIRTADGAEFQVTVVQSRPAWSPVDGDIVTDAAEAIAGAWVDGLLPEDPATAADVTARLHNPAWADMGFWFTVAETIDADGHVVFRHRRAIADAATLLLAKLEARTNRR